MYCEVPRQPQLCKGQEKRSFGCLWQIARTEVIEAPHKGALHTGHIGLTERFDAGQLLRVRQGDYSAVARTARRPLPLELGKAGKLGVRKIHAEQTGTMFRF